MTVYSKIIGTGACLPKQQVSNHALVDRLAQKGIETSHEWIVERSGIHARYHVTENELVSDLAAQAAQEALRLAQIASEDIDLIIVATATPDMVFPSMACLVQSKIGAKGCAAFDVQAACTGFIYALAIADSMIKSGLKKNALVIGAEAFSRLMNFDDRTTCVLFGDGAGAVVLARSETPGVLACDIHADGEKSDVLQVNAKFDQGGVVGAPYLVMDGKAVFKLAVALLERTAKIVLEKANVTSDAIDWFVPHQANFRIIAGTAKKLKLPMDKVILTLNRHGNTSAASVPLALHDGVVSGKIKPGHMVLLEGVGGGFTWGSVLLKM